MENENIAEGSVETPIAGETPVEKTEEEVVTIPKAQVEELVKAAEEATQLAEKKAEDAENYKKGMLKYKSQLADNGIEEYEEQSQSFTKEDIAQIVAQEVAKVVPQVVTPKEDELVKQKRTIEELKNVIANRPSTVPSSLGNNLDKPEATPNSGLSPELKDELAKAAMRIGADPEVFISDFQKNLANPQGAPPRK
jgi:putative cell wall-binding protein